MFRKILLALVGIIVVAVAALAIYVMSRQNLKFDAPYPEISASTDSAVVARGHYIVRTVSPCASDTAPDIATASECSASSRGLTRSRCSAPS